jgi:hypothetical protein
MFPTILSFPWVFGWVLPTKLRWGIRIIAWPVMLTYGDLARTKLEPDLRRIHQTGESDETIFAARYASSNMIIEKRIKKGAASEVSFERKMRRGEKPPEVWLKPYRGGFASTSFCSRRWRAECVFNYAFLDSSSFHSGSKDATNIQFDQISASTL